MPEIQVETIKENSETYEQVYGRLMKLIRDEKDITQGHTKGTVFTPQPGIQELGSRYICRWKYKQYS